MLCHLIFTCCFCSWALLTSVFVFILFPRQKCKRQCKIDSKYKWRVISFVLDAVYNIKEWQVRYAEQLHDHTQPKCYKFIRNASGKCGMFYQKYSYMPWEGSVVILKVQLWFFNWAVRLKMISPSFWACQTMYNFLRRTIIKQGCH